MVKGYKAAFTPRSSIAPKLTSIFQERTTTKIISVAKTRGKLFSLPPSATPLNRENRQFVQK